MRRLKLMTPLITSLVMLLAGCQAAKVAHDGVNFRQALLDMYTDQAIDNLIRARTGQAFVQLDYKDLLVQVTDQYFGELSNAQQVTTNEGTGLKAVSGLIPRAIQNTFNIHGSAQRQGQMSFHADPITDKNDVYEAYLKFANDPGLLIVSDCPPPKGEAHIQRKQCGQYFWVPCYAAPRFQELLLKTTFMRGPETLPPGFYERMIVKVIDPQQPEIRFDLKLMPLVKDVSEIPTQDKSRIIVAKVNKALHFRIFDVDGTKVVDTDEASLKSHAPQIEELRNLLRSFQPPHELTRSNENRIMAAVKSIVGFTPNNPYWSATLQFDKPVPNGLGWLVFNLPNGRKVRLRLLSIATTPGKKLIREGEDTTYLDVEWDRRKDEITDQDLDHASVRIFLNDFPPAMREAAVMEEIRHDVNRIRSSISPLLRGPGN